MTVKHLLLTKNLFFVLFLFFNSSFPFYNSLLALTFTEIGSGSLEGVLFTSTSLGDIDNDGDLDLILTGQSIGYIRVSRIYTNDGAGGFVESNPGSIENLLRSTTSLGDIDNDGDLDLILTGNNGSPVSRIYTNNGNGVYSETGAGTLDGVYFSSTTLGDIDNDGDLDLVLTGYNGSSLRVSRVYTNEGGGIFIENDIATANIEGLLRSSTSMGDIDNDGDLDLIITLYSIR